MMSRSGAFNVPVDFFKDRGMAAGLGAHAGRSRLGEHWGFYLGLACVCSVIGVLVALFAKSSNGNAQAPSVAPVPSAVATIVAPGAASSLAAPAPAPDNASAERPSPVLIAADPPDAHVFVDDEDIGVVPVKIEVPAGSKVTVSVKREGWRPLTASVDGSQPQVKLHLTRAQGARPAPTRTTRGTDGNASRTTPSTLPSPASGTEIVNPWATPQK